MAFQSQSQEDKQILSTLHGEIDTEAHETNFNVHNRTINQTIFCQSMKRTNDRTNDRTWSNNQSIKVFRKKKSVASDGQSQKVRGKSRELQRHALQLILIASAPLRLKATLANTHLEFSTISLILPFYCLKA